jgi:hypothetical protein
MEWPTLLALPTDTPISVLHGPREQITTRLWRLTLGQYVIVRRDIHADQTTVVVAAALWAASDDLATAVTEPGTSVPASDPGPLGPPGALLPAGEPRTFGGIRKALLSRTDLFIAADYAADGRFCFRHIQTRRRKYYFRNSDGDTDPVAAIRHLLR